MHEHIARTVYYVGIHLLYASMVWSAAWALTSVARASATTKYWIWVATSLNFILPSGALLDKTFAAHLAWAAPLPAIGDLGLAVADHAGLISSVWLAGFMLMLTRLILHLRADRTKAETADAAGQFPAPSHFVDGIAVRFSGPGTCPAVRGVIHPHISLPRGIESVLTEREVTAVLLHELTHARRRDNLIRLLQELSQCVLWFHPLVWLTGSHLALYRELSCDEAVIAHAQGKDLVAALAKLANPQTELVLQATASSFMSLRLARLIAPDPKRIGSRAGAYVAASFGAVVVAGIFETVAHTACCFVHKL